MVLASSPKTSANSWNVFPVSYFRFRLSDRNYCFCLDASEDVFKIGSTHPAAMLYDAYDHFEVRRPRGSRCVDSICRNKAFARTRSFEAFGRNSREP